ncbi:sensor histidine kinase [Desulfovibrio psychrotolerans]|uniref:histidine kinase n=1 Tax=Desulfovibrio psychrotolerans TaxID=415242 RepID=A0A7J0BTI8_9BACT|nr:PAS domain-containing sensor histidine kinase [Desulfovibrio psychrotolerans]GFM37027.1 two-component sensor histidine kinase [Desulfovibrio psychrotolerans]
MTDNKYSRLLGRIVFISLGFSLIPLITLSAFMYHQFTATYNAKVASNLRTMVENKRMSVDLFLDEKIFSLHALARLHEYEAITSPGYLKRVFREISSHRTPSFVDLGVIDGNGKHVAYEGPYRLEEADYSDADWFQEVLMRGVHVSDVFMGLRRFPHFVIAIRRDEGERTWILRATVDLNLFNSLVQSVQVGERGDAFLMNGNGELQTASRFNGGPLARAPIEPVERFRGVRTRDAAMHGRAYLAGMAWLEKAPWVLVISEDLAEGMSPLLSTQTDVLLITGFGVIFIVLGTILTSRTVVERIRKADLDSARLDASLLHQSKMAALGKMAAGVAHELNNPLTLIREAAGWLRDLMDPDEKEPLDRKEGCEVLDRIDSYIERARGITHRMLSFGRRMDPVREHVNLNQLVGETVAFLENEAMHRSITIEKEYDPALPTVSTDPSQMQQVFLNLIDNAIDAVGEDGVITVRTSVYGDGKFARVEVVDTGPGIPQHVLDKVFDPFFTTKSVGEGTGLGLAISFGIVENMGGHLLVDSEVGKGTTFSVLLPLG